MYLRQLIVEIWNNVLNQCIADVIISATTNARSVAMNFSDKVKTVRMRLELSQEDLARELKISYATVNRWENNVNKPSKMARRVFEEFCDSHKIEFADTNDSEVK